MPPEFTRNARRFLYYQLYLFLAALRRFPAGRWHLARLRPAEEVSPQKLTPAHSPAMHTILDGMLQDGNFLLDDDR